MKNVVLMFAVSSTLFGAASIRPDQLSCEYRENPQGIDVVEPRLSWVLSPSDPKARGLRQSAYQIVVSSSGSEARGDLWDSGKVESARSIQVVYAGKQLRSGIAAYWKVKVWDQDGAASNWSEPARWSMGLLRAEDWRGKWIGRDEKGVMKDPDDPYNALNKAHWIWSAQAVKSDGKSEAFFRGIFDVPAGRKLQRALAIAGADSQADVFINGKMVNSRSPAIIPSIADVTDLVHKGKNVIAVHAIYEVPGGATSSATRGGAAIGVVRLDYATGEPIVLSSSNQWQSGGRAEAGWEKIGFQAVGWSPAQDLGGYGMQPWGEVGFSEARRLPARMLRKEFPVSNQVRRATVYASGLGISEIYVNGRKLGDAVLSPGLTDYDKHVLYVTYDVTSQLKRGVNAIGLMLGNGRYYAPRLTVPIATRTFGYPKALVDLDIEFENGERSRVVSDGTWKLTTDGPIRANNEYDGEEYDARREPRGWNLPGFDDAKWEHAQVVSAPAGVLTAQMAEPLKVVQTLRPATIKQLQPGLYIYDMGQNMVGWTRLTVSGPKGSKITLRHAETLDANGDLYIANLRSARATDVYTLKGEGTEVWEPRFTYHGFRYVELSGFPGKPTLATIEGRVVHDAMEQTADFVSSNEMLNKIHHNIFWGVRGNYRSIATDCPQRDERQGWLGDRSQVNRSESYLFNVAAFYSKWMTDLADSERPTGSVPDFRPITGRSIPTT